MGGLQNNSIPSTPGAMWVETRTLARRCTAELDLIYEETDAERYRLKHIVRKISPDIISRPVSTGCRRLSSMKTTERIYYAAVCIVRL